RLAPSTWDALAEFMREKDEQARRFEDLRLKAEQEHEARIATMEDFEEDWNHSQFWYSDETASALAEALLEGATEDTVIGLVSAPTVYVKIREWKSTGRISKNITVKLFEFDQRFAVFKDDFIPYNFQHPLRALPPSLKAKFDRVLIDPPFLSEDCQTKTALTVRWMTKPWVAQRIGASASAESEVQQPRIMLCTGERMKDLVLRLYRPAGVITTTLDVQHHNKLNNDFHCYSNFEHGEIRFLEE
ncbi:N-6 adenine-specific DNA methyltransferas-like protein 2, partial [Wilcoxina mikolae CBS 423.85]